MKNAYLYCKKQDLNNATLHYIDVVSRSLERDGYKVAIVFDFKEIKKPNLIFTVTCTSFTKAKIRFPFVKTISWIQGIMYEESKMKKYGLLKRLVIFAAECLTVLNADYLLFVSERMREYYRIKVGYKKTNYSIMPCYNCSLVPTIDDSKYENATFVYAGGISKWQSFDKILDTYALVEQRLPKSKLYLYCEQTDQLFAMINSRNIKNFEVRYVPYEKLAEEMAHYKYGFIIREKNWVNEVSTPTKMNSYLASYLIPIYSNAVDEFKRNIELGEFSLMASTPLCPHDIARMVIKFEEEEHDYSMFKSKVKGLFGVHYNDERYITQIAHLVQGQK